VFDQFGSMSLQTNEPDASATAVAVVKSDWVQVFDEDKTFYYNKATKQSAWMLPAGEIIIPVIDPAAAARFSAPMSSTSVDFNSSIEAPVESVPMMEGSSKLATSIDKQQPIVPLIVKQSSEARSVHPASCGGQWVLDHLRTACNLCKAEFSFFRRRHHCRCCYDIFCSKCSDVVDKIRKCKPCQQN
jgi:hypothetical protein